MAESCEEGFVLDPGNVCWLTTPGLVDAGWGCRPHLQQPGGMEFPEELLVVLMLPSD